MHLGHIICGRLPKRYIHALKTEAKYGGMEEGFEEFMLYLFATLLPFSLLNFLLLYFGFRVSVFMAVIPSFFTVVAVFFTPYLLFTLMAESRKREIEAVLPDILLLTSANIKSGMTIDRAILFSARPEFGTISEHFKKAAFKIYGGAEVEDALSKMTQKIKSGIFSRTMDLLLEGIKGGGSIAKLLEETAADIRSGETIQREIKSTVTMYVMFLIIAGVIGAPLLYAISTFMMTSISSMWGEQTVDAEMSSVMGSAGGGLTFSSPANLDVNAFSYFAIAAIIVTTFFAGIIISMIQTGNGKQGIKYVPAFIAAALTIYFAAKALLVKMFGSLLGVS